jgi:Truncated hemoglobins
MTSETAPSPFAVHESITEALIARLMTRFYAQVRADPLLGPVFAARIEDWPRHEARIADFWSSVMLRTRRYDGRPMAAHLPLPIEGRHFDRWLALFEESAREVCPPEAAALFVDRARRIADSFEMGLATVRGDIHAPRHAARG